MKFAVACNGDHDPILLSKVGPVKSGGPTRPGRRHHLRRTTMNPLTSVLGTIISGFVLAIILMIIL
jgi:hypothetical protein